MQYLRAMQLAMFFMATGTALAQTDLPAFLSAVQSLATVLDPSSTSSISSSPTSRSSASTKSTSSSSTRKTSSTSSLSSTSGSSSASSLSSTSNAAATTTTPSASLNSSSAAQGSSSGLDPHTRDIIIGIAVPFGLIILAATIVLLFLCCRSRRRRRDRRAKPDLEYDETKIKNHNDWERGDSLHHGFSRDTGGLVGYGSNVKQGTNRDTTPLIGTGNTRQNIHRNEAPLVGTGNARQNTHHNKTPLMGTNNVRSDTYHNETALMGSGNIRQNTYHSEAPLMGTSNTRPDTHHNGAPLMGTSTFPDSRSMNPSNSQVLPTPPQSVQRKPVPNRHSDSSATTVASSSHRHSGHNGAIAGAGLGALAGAAAMHHHNNHRNSSGNLTRTDALHKPLGSHPQNQSAIRPTVRTSNGSNDSHTSWKPNRPSTPPFSPDDVGSMHRRSQRFSDRSTTANDFAEVPLAAGHINPPTSSQRHSLQSRHSASRSPRRRSGSGGGELWEADSMFRPALASQGRGSSGELQYVATEAAPPLPNQRRYSGRDIPQGALLPRPSPPHNKHLAAVQHANSGALSNDGTTDSSDSWESAQAELNPWEWTDPGRYPRLSGGAGDSRVPLIPPEPVWNEGGQRRWSGDPPKSVNGFRPRQDNRRYSGGNGRAQRLRFSDGNHEHYDDAGLVGRAL